MALPLLDIITAIFGGGITGIIGTVTTAVINYKTQKIKNEHEVAMERIKIDTMKAQAEIAKGLVSEVGKEVKDAMASATEVQDSIAYGKSQQYGNEQVFSSNWIEKLLQVKGWTSWISFPIAYIIIILFGVVDFLKGLMRPGITLYMMVASTWITYLTYGILEKAGIEKLEVAEALNVFNGVIVVIIYLTISCVTWWFGDRRTAKFLMRLKDGNFKLEGETKEEKGKQNQSPF
jgi:hypothetical protein